ncbi:helix-turn-helix transcriptional regulator [Streptococcus uberis]|uniref:helix-turn-helix domain-containing protein n=1 Tax=Streptococcus uberis TaxID=1349 RepID=UPI001FF495AF|nr:helix-turn-helix transcriptional regulator [Streptococcus uberis]MCK1190088.1 helix-turn-helix domain-containing protein [Streptococcus uberis]
MENKRNNLKYLIKKSNETKKGISEKLGINPRTLTRWERGETNIPSDKAQLLANYFGVSVNHLLGGEIDEYSFFTGLGRELFSLLTDEEKETLNNEPTLEEYFISLAWDRMLKRGNIEPEEIQKISNKLNSDIGEQDIKADEMVEQLQLKFITDIDKIKLIKSDILVSIRFIENIRDNLTEGTIKPFSYAWKMENISNELIDLLNQIEIRENELKSKL